MLTRGARYRPLARSVKRKSLEAREVALGGDRLPPLHALELEWRLVAGSAPHADPIPGPEFASEDGLRERILEPVLDESPQRTCPEDRVVSLPRQEIEHVLVHVIGMFGTQLFWGLSPNAPIAN